MFPILFLRKSFIKRKIDGLEGTPVANIWVNMSRGGGENKEEPAAWGNK